MYEDLKDGSDLGDNEDYIELSGYITDGNQKNLPEEQEDISENLENRHLSLEEIEERFKERVFVALGGLDDEEKHIANREANSKTIWHFNYEDIVSLRDKYWFTNITLKKVWFFLSENNMRVRISGDIFSKDKDFEQSLSDFITKIETIEITDEQRWALIDLWFKSTSSFLDRNIQWEITAANLSKVYLRRINNVLSISDSERLREVKNNFIASMLIYHLECSWLAEIKDQNLVINTWNFQNEGSLEYIRLKFRQTILNNLKISKSERTQSDKEYCMDVVRAYIQNLWWKIIDENWQECDYIQLFWYVKPREKAWPREIPYNMNSEEDAIKEMQSRWNEYRSEQPEWKSLRRLVLFSNKEAVLDEQVLDRENEIGYLCHYVNGRGYSKIWSEFLVALFWFDVTNSQYSRIVQNFCMRDESELTLGDIINYDFCPKKLQNSGYSQVINWISVWFWITWTKYFEGTNNEFTVNTRDDTFYKISNDYWLYFNKEKWKWYLFKYPEWEELENTIIKSYRWGNQISSSVVRQSLEPYQEVLFQLLPVSTDYLRVVWSLDIERNLYVYKSIYDLSWVLLQEYPLLEQLWFLIAYSFSSEDTRGRLCLLLWQHKDKLLVALEYCHYSLKYLDALVMEIEDNTEEIFQAIKDVTLWTNSQLDRSKDQSENIIKLVNNYSKSLLDCDRIDKETWLILSWELDDELLEKFIWIWFKEWNYREIIRKMKEVLDDDNSQLWDNANIYNGLFEWEISDELFQRKILRRLTDFEKDNIDNDYGINPKVLTYFHWHLNYIFLVKALSDTQIVERNDNALVFDLDMLTREDDAIKKVLNIFSEYSQKYWTDKWREFWFNNLINYLSNPNVFSRNGMDILDKNGRIIDFVDIQLTQKTVWFVSYELWKRRWQRYIDEMEKKWKPFVRMNLWYYDQLVDPEEVWKYVNDEWVLCYFDADLGKYKCFSQLNFSNIIKWSCYTETVNQLLDDPSIEIKRSDLFWKYLFPANLRDKNITRGDWNGISYTFPRNKDFNIPSWKKVTMLDKDSSTFLSLSEEWGILETYNDMYLINRLKDEEMKMFNPDNNTRVVPSSETVKRIVSFWAFIHKLFPPRIKEQNEMYGERIMDMNDQRLFQEIPEIYKDIFDDCEWFRLQEYDMKLQLLFVAYYRKSHDKTKIKELLKEYGETFLAVFQVCEISLEMWDTVMQIIEKFWEEKSMELFEYFSGILELQDEINNLHWVSSEVKKWIYEERIYENLLLEWCDLLKEITGKSRRILIQNYINKTQKFSEDIVRDLVIYKTFSVQEIKITSVESFKELKSKFNLQQTLVTYNWWDIELMQYKDECAWIYKENRLHEWTNVAEKYWKSLIMNINDPSFRFRLILMDRQKWDPIKKPPKILIWFMAVNDIWVDEIGKKIKYWSSANIDPKYQWKSLVKWIFKDVFLDECSDDTSCIEFTTTNPNAAKIYKRDYWATPIEWRQQEKKEGYTYENWSPILFNWYRINAKEFRLKHNK